MQKDHVDISIIITFHDEGILAHSTLNSAERCRKSAAINGITTEYIWVLDDCDEETRNIIFSHPAMQSSPKISLTFYGDVAEARNSGVNISEATAIAVLDGDDYFSTNWIEQGWRHLNIYGEKSIVHTEFVVDFGTTYGYTRQIDQSSRYFNQNGLLVGNYWTSWTLSHRNTYLKCPYRPTKALKTGFGYEDWHWNCETIASGFEHRLAFGTVGFYRRKKKGRVNSETEVGALIEKTHLFDNDSVKLNKK